MNHYNLFAIPSKYQTIRFPSHIQTFTIKQSIVLTRKMQSKWRFFRQTHHRYVFAHNLNNVQKSILNQTKNFFLIRQSESPHDWGRFCRRSRQNSLEGLTKHYPMHFPTQSQWTKYPNQNQKYMFRQFRRVYESNWMKPKPQDWGGCFERSGRSQRSEKQLARGLITKPKHKITNLLPIICLKRRPA